MDGTHRGTSLGVITMVKNGIALPSSERKRNGVFFSVVYLLAFLAPLIADALRDATGSFTPGFVVFSIFSFSLLRGGMMLQETKSPD